MEFKNTKEQENIFDFIQNKTENLLIQAYAGAGKTSTIVKSMDYLPKDKSKIFLAFNKHIQNELKTKLPEDVHCYTTYGLGLSSLKRKYKDNGNVRGCGCSGNIILKKERIL
jgi:superfamily II DNA or RNA helicase